MMDVGWTAGRKERKSKREQRTAWDDEMTGSAERERERAGSDSRLCALKDINPRCSSNLDVQQPMTKAAQF